MGKLFVPLLFESTCVCGSAVFLRSVFLAFSFKKQPTQLHFNYSLVFFFSFWKGGGPLKSSSLPKTFTVWVRPGHVVRWTVVWCHSSCSPLPPVFILFILCPLSYFPWPETMVCCVNLNDTGLLWSCGLPSKTAKGLEAENFLHAPICLFLPMSMPLQMLLLIAMLVTNPGL